MGTRTHDYRDTFVSKFVSKDDTLVSIGDKMAFLCQLGIAGLVLVVMSAREA